METIFVYAILKAFILVFLHSGATQRGRHKKHDVRIKKKATDRTLLIKNILDDAQNHFEEFLKK